MNGQKAPVLRPQGYRPGRTGPGFPERMGTGQALAEMVRFLGPKEWLRTGACRLPKTGPVLKMHGHEGLSKRSPDLTNISTPVLSLTRALEGADYAPTCFSRIT